MIHSNLLKTIGVGLFMFILGFTFAWMIRASVMTRSPILTTQNNAEMLNTKLKKTEIITNVSSEARVTELETLVKQKEVACKELISRNKKLNDELEKINKEFGTIVIPNNPTELGHQFGTLLRDCYLMNKKYGDHTPKQGEPEYEEYANMLTDTMNKFSTIMLGLQANSKQWNKEQSANFFSTLVGNSVGCNETQQSTIKQIMEQNSFGETFAGQTDTENTKSSNEERIKSFQKLFSDIKQVLSEEQSKMLEGFYSVDSKGVLHFSLNTDNKSEEKK